MADARAKLDILYQDVLGEIHEVINRVDALKAEIPAAAENLRGALSDVKTRVDGYAETATDRAASRALNAALDRELPEIRRTVESVIEDPIKTMVAKQERATEAALDAAEKALARASGMGGRLLAVGMLGGIVGALVVAGANSILNPTITPDQAQLIKRGQAFDGAWKSLTDDQRRIFNSWFETKPGKSDQAGAATPARP